MLKKMDICDYDEFYGLLERNFPVNERKGYEKQKLAFDSDIFKVLVLKDEQKNKIKGFVALWQVADYGFIEHFVVAEEYRSEGLGTKILKELERIYGGKIFLEVEPPVDEITTRRVNFYKRNGYFFNEFYYVMPALDVGREPIELKIMSCNHYFTQEQYKKLKAILFKDVYGQ